MGHNADDLLYAWGHYSS